MKRKEIIEGRRYIATLRASTRATKELLDTDLDEWAKYVPDWNRSVFVVKVLDTNAVYKPERYTKGYGETGVRVLIQKSGSWNGYWFGAWNQRVEEGQEVVIPAKLIVATVKDNERRNRLAKASEERREVQKNAEERKCRDLAKRLEKAGVRTHVCYSHGAWRVDVIESPETILELIEQ